MSDRLERTKRELMERFGYTAEEVEGFLEANRDQIEELSDPEFDLWFWAALIFGALSFLSFLLRLFSGSRSKKERAREEEREELYV